MIRQPLAAALIGTLAAAAAQAQETASTPYYLGARLGVSHEDNVFRSIRGTPESSDNITTLTLLGGLDQPIGRQRIYANGSVARSQYSKNENLDNTGYGLNAGVDWSTIGRLSGNVNLGASQSLARFNPGDAPLLTIRNVQQSRDLSTSVQLGVVTRLSLFAGANYRDLNYSEAVFQYREFEQYSVNGGVSYRFSGSLTTSVGLRHTDTRYPRFVQVGPDAFLSDRSKRDDIDLTASWTPGGASTVSGRLSVGQDARDELTTQDYSGITAFINWKWEPTGKLRFSTFFSRDTGRDSTALRAIDPTTPFVTEADNSRVNTAVGTQVGYSLTSKIGLNASASYNDRELSDTRSFSVGDPLEVTGSDATTVLSLGVTWAPLRSVNLGCNASHERRSTSSVLSSAYRANVYGCFGQVTLRL